MTKKVTRSTTAEYYIGLDVHKSTIHVAYAAADGSDPVPHGKTAGNNLAVERALQVDPHPPPLLDRPRPLRRGNVHPRPPARRESRRGTCSQSRMNTNAPTMNKMTATHLLSLDLCPQRFVRCLLVEGDVVR